MIRRLTSILACAAFGAASIAHAQIYLDVNGTIGGFGVLGGNTWNATNTNWTTDATGTSATTVWNNTSGTTTFDTTAGGGVVTVGDSFTVSGLSLVGSNNLSLNSGTTSRTITIQDTGSINVASARTLTITATSPAVLTVSGAGTWTKTGDGTLSFDVNSAMGSGTVNLNAGQITFRGTTASTHINMAAGTTFRQGVTAATAQTIGNLSGAGGIIDGAGSSNAMNLTITQSIDGTFSGVVANRISGGGVTNITKAGAATLTLAGANTYTGTTTISAGTLEIGNGGTTGNLGTGNVTNNATLRFNRSNAYTVANVISGTGAVTQAGSGTTELTGANTYSGATTINNGTLLVSTGTINSTSGITINSGGRLLYNNTGTGLTRNVTLNSGGTFRNNGANYTGTLTWNGGTVGGSNFTGVALNVASGRTLSPGNSTGTLTAGATTFADGGSFLFEINDATGTAGSTTFGWDLLDATSLNITAGVGQFTLQIASLDNTQNPGNALNFADLTSYNWLFVDTGSTITSFSASSFVINTSGFTNTFTGTFGIARGDTITGGDDTQLYITYTAIPEPSTYAMVLGGLLALALLRRQGRKKV